jgi:hypothetical protein
VDLTEFFHLNGDQKLTGVNHRRPVLGHCEILFAAETGDRCLNARQLVSGIAVGLCQCAPRDTAQMLIGTQLIHVPKGHAVGVLATPNTFDRQTGACRKRQTSNSGSAGRTGLNTPRLKSRVIESNGLPRCRKAVSSALVICWP